MSFFQPVQKPESPLARLRVLSPTAGVRVSPLALGAMSIGESWKQMMGSMDKESSFKLLDAFFEAGGNFIDTANNYQNDDSEKWLGEWMKERDIRDRLVIATKYTTNYMGYKIGVREAANYQGNHKKSMNLSLRDSLKKLQTEYVDILYMHWLDWTTSVEEVMDSLHLLVAAGKVLYLGISDAPAWWVAKANTYAKMSGKTPFVIYQGRWNCMLRDMEREIIPMCRNFGMAITPWDAIGGGRLQSAKAMEERKKNGENIRAMMGGPEQTEREKKYSQVLYEVAQEHGIESVTTIALAWIMSKTPYVFPMIGGRKVEHLKDNIKSLEIKLTDEQIKKIESVEEFDLGFPSNFIGTDSSIDGKVGFFLASQTYVDIVKGPQPLGHL